MKCDSREGAIFWSPRSPLDVVSLKLISFNYISILYHINLLYQLLIKFSVIILFNLVLYSVIILFKYSYSQLLY